MAVTPPKSGDVATAAEMGREDRAAVPRFHKIERAMEGPNLALQKEFRRWESDLGNAGRKMKDFSAKAPGE
jgi:hypothetical protein